MTSSNIPDSVNFDLLYQEIPGTYNTYDRKTIHETLNLILPAKIQVNNWSDQVRWKNFVKFPPRSRSVMIKDLDEIESDRLREMGIKVDPGLDKIYKKLDLIKFTILKYTEEGKIDNDAVFEELSFFDIFNDSSDKRKRMRLTYLIKLLNNDKDLNLLQNLVPGISNQEVALELARKALKDLKIKGVTLEIQESGDTVATISDDLVDNIIQNYPDAELDDMIDIADIIGTHKTHKEVSDDISAMSILLKTLGKDYDNFMNTWSETPDKKINIEANKDEMIKELTEEPKTDPTIDTKSFDIPIGQYHNSKFISSEFLQEMTHHVKDNLGIDVTEDEMHTIINYNYGRFIDFNLAEHDDDKNATISEEDFKNTFDSFADNEAMFNIQTIEKEAEEEEEEAQSPTKQTIDPGDIGLDSTYAVHNRSDWDIGLPGNPREIGSEYYNHTLIGSKTKLILFIYSIATDPKENIKGHGTFRSTDDTKYISVNSLKSFIRDGKGKVTIAQHNIRLVK